MRRDDAFSPGEKFMTIDIDQTVRLKTPVIEGVVTDIQYNKESRSLQMLVEFVEDGEIHTRWFDEAHLEVVQ